MNVWIIRCVTPGVTWYRAWIDGVRCWSSLLDNAEVYTDDTLPPGTWDKVNAEEVS